MGTKITFTFLLTIGGMLITKGMSLVDAGDYLEGALLIIGGGVTIGVGVLLLEKGFIEYEEKVRRNGGSS